VPGPKAAKLNQNLQNAVTPSQRQRVCLPRDETNPIFPSTVLGPEAAKLNQNLQNAVTPSQRQPSCPHRLTRSPRLDRSTFHREIMPFRLIVLFAVTIAALAQTATMKQLMLDLIHPSSNQILLIVNRGGPADDKQWAAVRHSALTLAESGELLARIRSTNDWPKDAKLLSDAGSAAYRAALAKDSKALAAATDSLDASCTTCHKQFRPDVFPRQEASK
ncbi:MAG TPA: hypothetical protein VH640_07480, partial [Bryobacteraceae bacterium]